MSSTTSNSTNFAAELLAILEPYVPNQLREIDLHGALRLVIIVGGYAFARNIAQKYLAKRQLERQIEHDKATQHEGKVNDLVDDPNEVHATGLDSGSWGFGKKTKRNVKRQQKILQEQLESMHAGVVDDDKDIEDLLEE